MNKNLISIIIGIVLVTAGIFVWSWQSGKTPNPSPAIPEGIILFYGDGCPHCKNVDDFIAQNKIEDKVQFQRLEVWYNQDNQNILGQVVRKCNIKDDQVGVPFLWDGSKCYIGEDETVNFFKQKAGIQ
jgi:hypothetical protein